MGFGKSKFGLNSFGAGKFGNSNFSEGRGGSSSSSDADTDRNDAWLWEDGSHILWDDGLSLILLES